MLLLCSWRQETSLFEKGFFYLYAIWTSDIPGVCEREPFVHLNSWCQNPPQDQKNKIKPLPQNIWTGWDGEEDYRVQEGQNKGRTLGGEGKEGSASWERFHANAKNILWYGSIVLQKWKKKRSVRKHRKEMAMQKVALLRCRLTP